MAATSESGYREIVEGGEATRRSATKATWWPVRVAALAAVVTCLGLGLLLSNLIKSVPITSLAVADPARPITHDPVIETEVLGAIEVRADDFVAASVEHLVVVAVSVTACGERATGTGVLVANDTILTAAHTVGDAGIVRVVHGQRIFSGEVRGVFADGRDLAVIDLEAPLPGPVAAAPLPRDGTAVTIVGFPAGGLRASVVGPTVVVPERAERLLTGPLAAVQAPTRAGMSGGPAVDSSGNLVGILVASQPDAGTAVLAAIDDVATALETPLRDGECAATA